MAVEAIEADATMGQGREGLVATYIGGPTVLIEAGGYRLLTDPTFDAPGDTYVMPRIGAETRKLAGPGVEASAIGRIDIVLLSHDEHGDNLDESGRRLLPQAQTVVTTHHGAERLGGNAHGLNPFEQFEHEDLRITATPARHGPEGCEPMLGDVIGFVVESASGVFEPFYVSGDTVLFDDLRQIGERFRVGTAFLNLGRVGGSGEPHFTMGAEEASTLARQLDAERIVPLHYEDWAHFSESRDVASQVFERDGVAGRVHWLVRGARTPLA